jgi:hypothetical protein
MLTAEINNTALSLGWPQPEPPRNRRRQLLPLINPLPTEPPVKNLPQSSDQHPLPVQKETSVESLSPNPISVFLQKLIYGSRPDYSSGQNSTLESVVPETEFCNLHQQYELRDELSIKAYLRKYPFLIRLLLEAKTQVTHIFGEETKPALQISIDPNDWSAQLFIVIPTQLNVDEISVLFDQLDKEWWIEASEKADYRMNFIPEFI